MHNKNTGRNKKYQQLRDDYVCNRTDDIHSYADFSIRWPITHADPENCIEVDVLSTDTAVQIATKIQNAPPLVIKLLKETPND